MIDDIYQKNLINPILRAKTVSQARSRARVARKVLDMSASISKMSPKEQAKVLDRIDDAEVDVIDRIEKGGAQ